MELDGISLRILASMQEDASRATADLADEVGLSQNACWRRIRQLEEAGYIQKRVALLDAKRLGAGLTVFVTVRAVEHTEEWLESFAATVAAIPEVVEFYRMSGEVDYLLKLRVADIEAYDQVYKSLIQRVRLLDLSGSFVMETIKHTTAVPIPHSSGEDSIFSISAASAH